MSQNSNLITGQTGTAAPTIKPASPANQQRNRDIQERLRRHLAENPTPQVAAGVPSVKPKEVRPAVVQTPMEVSRQPAPASRVVQPAVARESFKPGIVRTDVPATVASKAPIGRIGPGAREDGYVPAVGTQRDMTTMNPNVYGMNEPLPEEELIAGRNATEGYGVIPGLNVEPPSPYRRLTDPEFSEFALLFAQSPYAPEARGVVGIPHPAFPWNRDIELPSLQGPDLVRMPQGFYGYNPANGGPTYVMIRLDKNLIIWNFNHTPGNCRIFYFGRSNKTGRWYPPESLDKLELFTTVAELAQLRARLVAEAQGKTYQPGGRSLL